MSAGEEGLSAHSHGFNGLVLKDPVQEQSSWIDATDLFRAGCQDLHQGEIFHGPNFSLFNTMSAIQIGEPRMDSGALWEESDLDESNSLKLSDAETIGLMDQLLCCTASWHQGASLTSTLLRCVLVHRPEISILSNIVSPSNAPENQLSTIATMPFVVAICKSVYLAWKKMTEGNFYDGEDIILERFGVSLADDVSNEQVANSLEDAIREVMELPQTDATKAVLCRLQLAYYLLENFAALDLDGTGTGSAFAAVHTPDAILSDILQSSHQGKSAARLFDDDISAKVIGCLPPRPVVLVSLQQAVDTYVSLSRGFSLCDELSSKTDILSVEDALRNIADTRPSLTAYTRSCIHTLLCGASGKFAMTSPPEFMAKMLGEYGFCGVAETLVHQYIEVNANGTSDFHSLFSDGIDRAYHIYLDYASILLHNLPRQRRNLGKLLEHAQDLSLYLGGIAPPTSADEASAMAILLFWLKYIIDITMVKILRDGFFLELYSAKEYPSMLFCLSVKLSQARSRLETWQLAGFHLADSSCRRLEHASSIINHEYLVFDALLRLSVAVTLARKETSIRAEESQEKVAFNRRMYVLTTRASGQPFRHEDFVAHTQNLENIGIAELLRTAKSSLGLAASSSNRTFRANIKDRDKTPVIYSIMEAQQTELQNVALQSLAFASAEPSVERLASAEWGTGSQGSPLALHTPVHVLVTNDDGPPNDSESPFIVDFVRSLREMLKWRVTVVIPASQKSWISKAFHIKEHIQTSWLYLTDAGKVVEQSSTPNIVLAKTHDEWVLLDGTPSTCVNIGLDHFCGPKKFDLVLAGPNFGRNTSTAFALSSGTIGAAMEGSLCGVPSIALSYGLVEKPVPEGVTPLAHKIATRIVQKLWDTWPGRNGRAGEAVALYNINIPLVRPLSEQTEVRWTKMHRNTYGRLFKVIAPGTSPGTKPDNKSAASTESKPQQASKTADGPPAAVSSMVTRDRGPTAESAKATTMARSERLTFHFAPDVTSLIAFTQDLPLDTDARALQTDSVISVTALRTGFDEVPLHLARQQADLNQSRQSLGPLRLRGGAALATSSTQTAIDPNNYEPLSNTLMPLTDATVTIRVIKNFEYRIQRSAVVHHLDLTQIKVSDLLAIIKNIISQDPKFKAFRAQLADFDTFKMYTQAHKSKTSNLIINLEDGGILDDPLRTLLDYGVDHECEISLFNRKAYETFKLDPQIKWN